MGTMAASTLCRPGEGRGPSLHLVKANKIRPIHCIGLALAGRRACPAKPPILPRTKSGATVNAWSVTQ